MEDKLTYHMSLLEKFLASYDVYAAVKYVFILNENENKISEKSCQNLICFIKRNLPLYKIENFELEQKSKAKISQLYSSGDFINVKDFISFKYANEINKSSFLSNIFGLLSQNEGSYQDAVDYFDQSIQLNPLSINPYLNMGNLFFKIENFQEAILFYRRSLLIKPTSFQSLNALALCYMNSGQNNIAVKKLEESILLFPNNPTAFNSLGLINQNLGNHQKSIYMFKKSLEFDSNNFEALYNLALSYKISQNLKKAYSTFKKALLVRSNSVDTLYNLGNTCVDLKKFIEAKKYFLLANKIDGSHYKSIYNLAHMLSKQGFIEKAIQYYTKVIQMVPDNAEARWNRARCLLLIGNYSEGFHEYEWRWKRKENHDLRNFFKPKLKADDKLTGKVILVHAEQGLGDTLQFIQYIQFLTYKGAKVLFSPQPALTSILEHTRFDFEIVDWKDKSLDYDYYIPLLSLPNLFGIPKDSAVSFKRYINSPPLSKTWVLQRSKFRIGICWQGSTSKIDEGRSLPLELFQSIASELPVELVSLHKGEGEKQIEDIAFPLTTFAPEFDGGEQAFLDTAGVINQCDLIITTDTSIVHLAGAMGARTWLLLQKVPDWRWGLSGKDTFWYPSVEIFRQQKANDWGPVFQELFFRLKAELGKAKYK